MRSKEFIQPGINKSANPSAGEAIASPRRSQRVAISALRPGDSLRDSEDIEHIHRLSQIETPLPPILVHRATMRVIDGMHRLKATILQGRQEIEVVFFEGTLEDAFIRGVKENIKHGLPLSLADRRAAARRIIGSHPQLSDRSIAASTGLSAKAVGALRLSIGVQLPEPGTRMGADGRLRPLNSAEGRRRAAQIIAQNPNASVREIARMAMVSVGTAHDVRRRIRRGEDPLPSSRRSGGMLSQQPGTVRTYSAPTVRVPGNPPHRAELTEPTELSAMVRQLTRDPALRHTNLGRELLRLLNTQSAAMTGWSALIRAVPPHCTDTIAKIARNCAERWDEFADEIEHRARLDGT